VRRLMEMVAENKAKLAATANPSESTEVELTEQAQTAAETAAAVLAANPATGPAEVVYIGPTKTSRTVASCFSFSAERRRSFSIATLVAQSPLS
jgi:hypothetical protein